MQLWRRMQPNMLCLSCSACRHAQPHAVAGIEDKCAETGWGGGGAPASMQLICVKSNDSEQDTAMLAASGRTALRIHT